MIIWDQSNLNFSILCLSFSEFRQFDDLSRFNCQNIEDNLIRLEKNGKIYFKNKIAFCPSCNSRNTVKNGTYERKLIFLRIGGGKFALFKRINVKNVVKSFIMIYLHLFI